VPVRSGETLAESVTCVPDMVAAGVNVFRFGTARCENVEQMFVFIDELAKTFALYR